ncbi:MAG: CHAT domain-containing protein [Chthonomonadales bacterium]|nr:CHAT domain-containing protein [Chthonomonadales bacterium]
MRTIILTIGQRAAAGYPARLYLVDGNGDVPEQPAGETVIPLDLGGPDAPGPDGEPAVAHRLRSVLLEAAGYSTDLRRVGRHLHSLLHTGTLADAWDDLRERYPREAAPEQGLRTLLDMRDPDLRRLPWELLWDGGRRRFFADPANPFVRGRTRPGGQSPACTWPVRVLVVVGWADDDPAVRVADEVEGIEDAFRRMGKTVYFEVERRPAKDRLLGTPGRPGVIERLRPHIFHFIGHGRGPGGQGDTGALLIEAEMGGWELTAYDAAVCFPRWPPRFVCLNACRSSDLAVQEGAWAMADAFEQLGVPAVLGMQADVRGDAAARCAATLYAALADGEPLDVALARGRAAVTTLPDMTWDHRDWALPALALRVSPEQVLPVAAGAEQAKRRAMLERTDEFARLRNFVARTPERWELWAGVDPFHDDQRYSDMLVVVGEEQAGKTALVHWCLEGVVLRGRPVRYVNMRTLDSADFLGFLRLIARGGGSPPLDADLPAEAFHAFNRSLNRYQAGGPFTEGPGLPAVPDEDQGLPLRRGSERENVAIVQAFREALRHAAGDRPLILVLDHLRVEPEDWRNYLYPHLVRHIAEHSLHPMRLVLVVTARQYADFGLADHAGVAPVIRLEYFESKAFMGLAWEFGRYYRCLNSHIDGDDIHTLIQVLDNTSISRARWAPTELEVITKVFSRQEPAVQASLSDIVERLRQGEDPAALALSLLPRGGRELLRACALARLRPAAR